MNINIKFAGENLESTLGLVGIIQIPYFKILYHHPYFIYMYRKVMYLRTIYKFYIFSKGFAKIYFFALLQYYMQIINLISECQIQCLLHQLAVFSHEVEAGVQQRCDVLEDQATKRKEKKKKKKPTGKEKSEILLKFF